MRRRRGFTMVELIVVISIITILMGLLIAAIGHLRTSAKRTQTQQVLNNLQGMFADWDAVARVPFSASIMPCPMNVTSDLNPVTAMGPANDASISNRYGAAVWLMRDMMFNLKSVPNNAAAIAKMPADEIMTMPTNFDSQFPLPYTPGQFANGTNYKPFDGTMYGRVYLQETMSGTQVNVYYECIQANVSVLPPNPSYWLPAYPTFVGTTPSDNTVPIPLDGWGNPIIFVPGGALGSGAALGGGMDTGSGPAPGSGALEAGGVTFTVRSPDGRPFFASAGPDGDFSKGDDNLYSFEH